MDMLPSLEAKNWPLPLLTGVNGGHDLDLRRMAADGVTLLGHLQSVSGTRLIIAPDLKETLARADVWFTDFKKLVDDYVTKTGIIGAGPKGRWNHVDCLGHWLPLRL